MCGFMGCIGASAGADDLLKGLPRLRRRGPDSHKVWSSSDRNVHLLHARLAIIDQDLRAAQPFYSPEFQVAVAFNGEIYNHAELRRLLPEYPFKTSSDTEVIMAVYLQKGTEGFRLLKGMFSIVIVDERRRKVFLLRDAVGKKPLFLMRFSEKVLFGSSLLPLAAASGRPVRIRPELLSDYWEKEFVPPHTTLFDGAEPVLPGRLIELDWNGRIVGSFECRSLSARIYQGEPLADVQKNIRTLLTGAVEKRLDPNHRPALLLSGGIDSTVICSLAADLWRKKGCKEPLALTLGSFLPGTNDELYARYAARRLKMRLTIVRPDLSRLGASVLAALDLQDEPLGMPSFFLLDRLVAAASKYSKILITGDGGDEVFLGYGKPADWYNSWKREGTPACEGLPPWMSEWGVRMAGESLLGHAFPKADRASAERGVELRCPLLDGDLVSYARSLPFEILTHGTRGKALLKDQIRDWPRWFIDRKKIGFAYNLRWLWRLNGYEGLREGIDGHAQAAFGRFLPEPLRRQPSRWSHGEIFKHFTSAWRLLAWSRFLGRVEEAHPQL